MDEKIVSPTFRNKILAGAPVTAKPEPASEPEPEVVEETKSEEELDVPEEQKVNPTEINPNEPLFHAVADYLNITDQRDYSDAVPKVQYIVDWIVKDIGSNAYEDVISKVSELTHSIAKPDFDVKMYKHLYRYVRLKEQASAVNKALHAWEGKNHGN